MRFKFLFSLIIFLSFSVVKLIAAAEVPIWASMDIPKFINPGSEIVVNMSIERGDVEGFVKVEEFFPMGVVIKEVDSYGAEFSYVHNYLTLTWKQIPVEDVIKVKFKMFVPSTLEGKAKVEGKIRFMEKGKLSSIKFDDFDVTFQKEDDDEETNKTVETPLKVIVGQPTKTKGSIEKLPKPETPVTVNAKRSFTVLNANEVLVQIVVEQVGLTGFLKLEDLIPMGFKAKSDNTNGSTFSYLENKVKHVWSEIPAVSKISLAYKIIRDGNDAKKFALEGSLQYLDKGESKKIDLNDDVNLDYKPIVEPEKANEVTSNEKVNNTSIKSKTDKKESSPVDAPEAKKVVSKPAASKPIAKSESQGITYKIQICATQNKSDVDKVAQEFNVSESIEAEVQDGWYKYTVGSFKSYNEAKKFRNSKASIPTSPFISAYYNGKRISVQEANMINNQKLLK